MARVTIVFGVLLVILGLVGFVGTGSQHPTALIPAVLGVLLGILGFLAQSPVEKKRMLYMHIAVTLALLGFLGTVKGLIDYIRMEFGAIVSNPPAVESKAAMAFLTLIFVILCIRSFINARRGRAAGV